MTRRIATNAATMAALLVAPATAMGAQGGETVSVSGGVLTYTSDVGTVDTVTLADGTGGAHLISETTSPSGSIGSRCTYVGTVTASCTDATSAWLQVLDGDDSITVTASLPATLDGGAGNDTLTGGPAADTLLGGDGDDVIEARDGVVDTIDCGPGTDLPYVDANDVLSNCEPLPADAPVNPTGGTTTTETPTGLPVADPLAPPALDALPVEIETTRVAVGANGVAAFAVGCARTEPAACRGTMYLDPAPRRRARAHAARRGRYGHKAFAIAPGTEARVNVRLTGAARRALRLPRLRTARMARRGRRVKAIVTVVQRGKAPVRQRVTLRRR